MASPFVQKAEKTEPGVVELTLAHSPDSDDAFMFYALATKKLGARDVSFTHRLEDIETLNRKALEGVYDVTAISFHAYPYLEDKYVPGTAESQHWDKESEELIRLLLDEDVPAASEGSK